jgi:hypothetical protein
VRRSVKHGHAEPDLTADKVFASARLEIHVRVHRPAIPDQADADVIARARAC